jgi:hypothetical protein
MSRPTRSQDPFADDPFLDALQRAGARSPKDACSRSELPAVAEDLLAVFVATGTVRAARGGRYYLVPQARRGDWDRPARFTPLSVALMTGAWVVVLLVPLVAWLITR